MQSTETNGARKGTWEKGHKPLPVTPTIEDRLEPKDKSRTCKLRVKVWISDVVETVTSETWLKLRNETETLS